MIDAHITTLLEEWQTDRRPLFVRALERRTREKGDHVPRCTVCRAYARYKNVSGELRCMAHRGQHAPRGWAAMTPETRQRIASLGGKAAHARGKAHQWTTEEAREAGRRGGNAVWAKRRAAE